MRCSDSRPGGFSTWKRDHPCAQQGLPGARPGCNSKAREMMLTAGADHAPRGCVRFQWVWDGAARSNRARLRARGAQALKFTRLWRAANRGVRACPERSRRATPRPVHSSVGVEHGVELRYPLSATTPRRGCLPKTCTGQLPPESRQVVEEAAPPHRTS